MTQVATVRKVSDGMAEVQVARKTACGHDCSKCSGCSQVVTGETLIQVKNELKARQGDVVLIESKSSKILAAAMVVYILPFLLFFVFYFIVSAVLNDAEGSLPILGGLIGFFLGIVSAVLWDRHEKRKRSLEFQMVEIKQKCSDM